MDKKRNRLILGDQLTAACGECQIRVGAQALQRIVLDKAYAREFLDSV
ncbi:MAG: hypothetical protein RMJ44_04785 [Cytophagales bacterium]|nr:hypothetical protein [Bernardetiaceae bacterium]MDW8210382.1 hypothetical protein [Cytophagales bacterium]